MSQNPFSAVPVVPCPVCGAEPAARLWLSTFRGAAGSGTVVLQFDSAAFFPKLLRASSLVCTGCGYVQLFVDTGELRANLGQQREHDNA